MLAAQQYRVDSDPLRTGHMVLRLQEQKASVNHLHVLVACSN